MGTTTGKPQLNAAQWRALLDTAGDGLSHEEKDIAELLAQGKTQAAVGAQLGLHRSAVWRKAKAIAAKTKMTAK